MNQCSNPKYLFKSFYLGIFSLVCYAVSSRLRGSCSTCCQLSWTHFSQPEQSDRRIDVRVLMCRLGTLDLVLVVV